MDWVILAGNVGQEAPWTQGVPRPLLPLPGTTLIEALLAGATERRCGSLTVCANGRTELIAERLAQSADISPPVTFMKDNLPLGTAGCLKACEKRLTGGPIFVSGASVWLADDPEWMLAQHRAQRNALTVFCTYEADIDGIKTGAFFRPAGIFCCDPLVLDLIRPHGFQDIKEQLIPALQRAGHRVGAVTLREPTCEVLDWSTYLDVLGQSLSDRRFDTRKYRKITPDVWCGEDVTIADDARVVGPAFLGHGCRLDSASVVIGPTLLGANTHIEEGAWLVRGVAPANATITRGSCITDRFIAPPRVPGPGSHTIDRTASDASIWKDSPTEDRPTAIDACACGMQRSCVAALAVVGAFIWAFWHTLTDLWQVWQGSDDYSAGMLVGPAALYMMLTRRAAIKASAVRAAPLCVGVFAVGVAIHLAGTYYLYRSIENIGMLVSAHGLVLGLLGTAGYRRVWYPMAFLTLMLPLPVRVHEVVMLRLQTLGARCAGTVLELIGVPVVRQGNVLEVAQHSVAVAEACSGLRMAIAFLVVCGVLAFVMRRPVWQKVVILLSSIPIAIACNVLRIVSAAYFYSAGYDRLAEGVFHDTAGLLMIPVALTLLFIELRVLSNLMLPREAVAMLVDGTDPGQMAPERP